MLILKIGKFNMKNTLLNHIKKSIHKAVSLAWTHGNLFAAILSAIAYMKYAIKAGANAHQMLFGSIIIPIGINFLSLYLFTDLPKLKEKKRSKGKLKDKYKWSRYEVLSVFLKYSGSSCFPAPEILLAPSGFTDFFYKPFQHNEELNNWNAIMEHVDKEGVQEIKRKLDLFREEIISAKKHFDPLPAYLQKLSDDIHNLRDITLPDDQCLQLSATLWYFFTGARMGDDSVPKENPIEKEINEMQ